MYQKSSVGSDMEDKYHDKRNLIILNSSLQKFGEQQTSPNKIKSKDHSITLK